EQYRPIGETGWRGYVQKMRDQGVEVFEMIGEPENMVALQQAMQTEGWYPVATHLQTNFFDERFVAEGGSSVSEATYMASVFPTFDLADEVPAMADYLELMERYNPDGKVAMLGMQSLSAFLLFATAAKACGDDLTRACVIEQAAAQEGWTAGGLHSPQTPGNLEASPCRLAIRVTPDGFAYDEEMTDPNESIYHCEPDDVLELTGAYGVPRPERCRRGRPTMDQCLQATITGIATAAILAVAASGLVLTYTTTGIFNFAHGAIGMLGAFAYWQLRFDWGWPAPVALLVVLGVLAPLLGVAIELVVMRGLHDAPEAARVVVSVGLLAALLGLGLWVWPTDVARPLTRFWGNEHISVLGVRLTWHEVVAILVAAGLALGLRALLYGTRAGLAMRAAVDDRALSMLNGARPHRSAVLAWAIGCTCAALAGILISPAIGLMHVNLTLMIVNAYAAAMIGRLRNLPMTFAGAVALGLLDAYALTYLPTDSILLAQFRFAIPVILLFAVLLVLRQDRLRGHAARSTREVVPRPG